MQTSTRMRVVTGRCTAGRRAREVFETCTCDFKRFWRKEDMMLYESKSETCINILPSSYSFELDEQVSFSCMHHIEGIIAHRLVHDGILVISFFLPQHNPINL